MYFYTFLRPSGQEYTRPDCTQCFNRMLGANKKKKKLIKLLTGRNVTVQELRKKRKAQRDREKENERLRKYKKMIAPRNVNATKEGDFKEYVKHVKVKSRKPKNG